MAKRGGFPGMGMPGNMNNLMKQAQKMQRQMEENQKALEEKEFTATAGGGAVEVTISGKREVTKVKLQEEVVDPDDIEMLEDLIVAATNEALRKVEQESTSMMSKLTGGMGMGGGNPFEEAAGMGMEAGGPADQPVAGGEGEEDAAAQPGNPFDLYAEGDQEETMKARESNPLVAAFDEYLQKAIHHDE